MIRQGMAGHNTNATQAAQTPPAVQTNAVKREGNTENKSAASSGGMTEQQIREEYIKQYMAELKAREQQKVGKGF